MTSNYVHKFPQSLCEFPVCTGIFCLSSLGALVVCAIAGVLGPTEMSCVRIWFHFPPALTQSARCRARSPAACVLTSAPEWMQARYQAPVRGRTQRLRILNPAALGNFWRDTDMRGRQGNSVEGGNEKGFRSKNWSFLIEGVTRRFWLLSALDWLRQWDYNIWVQLISSRICKSQQYKVVCTISANRTKFWRVIQSKCRVLRNFTSSSDKAGPAIMRNSW